MFLRFAQAARGWRVWLRRKSMCRIGDRPFRVNCSSLVSWLMACKVASPPHHTHRFRLVRFGASLAKICCSSASIGTLLVDVIDSFVS